MDEQGRQILAMLAEGKINANEAERLINALERHQAELAPVAGSRPKSRPRYLRVLVGSADDMVEAIFEYRDAGITEFLFTGFPDLEQMRFFAAEVLPALHGG